MNFMRIRVISFNISREELFKAGMVLTLGYSLTIGSLATWCMI